MDVSHAGRLCIGMHRHAFRSIVALLALTAVGDVAAQAGPPARSASALPRADSSDFKHNILPVVETSIFLVALSIYDRVAYANVMQDGKRVYGSTFSSTWDHLRQQTWVYDQDPFNTNQFQHPYQGSMMYGFARSGGHGFWNSLVQSNIGSFIWKMAGETDPPSLNDMITTGQAGSLLGEALYRMADLVLKDGPPSNPDRWQEFVATAISPPSGINRRIFGDRFKAMLPETRPATFWQVRFGATLGALSNDYSSPSKLLRKDASTEFDMSYGLPGQKDYDYTRPLDYFDFQLVFLASAQNPVENVLVRGLLVGGKTADAPNARGIWGLYGSYDYIAPSLFRISSTAVSLGTTRQYSLSPGLSLQGSLLGGLGFGAAGATTVIASTPTNAAIRDYHFGLTPQALLALRLILGDRATFDLSARQYYVTGVGSDDSRGSEFIFRGNTGVTMRLRGNHAVGVQFTASTRDARYGSLPSKRMADGTISVSYTILGGSRMAAVDWK